MAPKKSGDVNFKKGEKVKAKWSGSNAFYDAEILDVFQKTCKVEFDDGTVTNVKMGDIRTPTYAKSKKDASPKRTRSRSRSVGRPRSRSRSPGRTEKKRPAAKNEKRNSRNRVDETSKEESPKTTNNVGKKDEVDSVTLKTSLIRDKIGSLKEDVKSSVSTTVTTSNSYMSKNLYVSLQKEDPSEMRLRATRMSSLRSSDVSSEANKSNAVDKKGDAKKYSDDEDSEDEEVKIIPKGPSKVIKVLYFLCTLTRIMIMPTSLLFLIYACTKRQCTVLEAPQFYARLKDFGNALKIPLPCVILFHLSICLLSLIPLGKKVAGFPYGLKKITRNYRLNGLLCLIPSIIVFGLCSYFGVYMNWGYDKIKSLSFSVALYCVLYSLVLQVVSLIHGNGEKENVVPVLGSFFNGVYFNPFIFGKVDVKTTFIRAGLVGSVLIILSVLQKYFLMKGYFNVPMAASAGMALFFVFDYFVREERMLSTATYTSDSVGYGFIINTGFLIPIGLSFPTVYLFIFEKLYPHWCSASMVALYLFGYYIYMSSGNLKHNFRSNPFSPTLSDVDSIPTSQKKRLISSKLWGIIRHPNYLGLIMMATAWTLPCGFSHVAPYGPLAMLIIALAARCIRVEGECKEKYGPAWSNYTEKVRSRLIPYIF